MLINLNKQSYTNLFDLTPNEIYHYYFTKTYKKIIKNNKNKINKHKQYFIYICYYQIMQYFCYKIKYFKNINKFILTIKLKIISQNIIS